MAPYEYDFSLDGTTASSVGIRLCRPIHFSAAEPDVQTFSLPGVNGDYHIDNGRFKNRTGKAECYAIWDPGEDLPFPSGSPQYPLDADKTIVHKMHEITDFLFGSTGYRKLETSEDQEFFWYARVANAAEIQPRLNLLNPFTITFDCKPFRVMKGSEILTSNTSFVNPTGITTQPLIYVNSASSGGSITSGEAEIKMVYGVGGFYIDCETGVAYYTPTVFADDRIKAKTFPKFGPGACGLVCDGVSVSCAPRWKAL